MQTWINWHKHKFNSLKNVLIYLPVYIKWKMDWENQLERNWKKRVCVSSFWQEKKHAHLDHQC